MAMQVGLSDRFLESKVVRYRSQHCVVPEIKSIVKVVLH